MCRTRDADTTVRSAVFVAALEGPPARDVEAAREDPGVFFRPSFGRRGTVRDASGAPTGPLAAPFGELDAIVRTRGGTYLVETKWSGSGEREPDSALRLRAEQVRRRRVTRAYVDAWRARDDWDSWPAFVAESGVRERLRDHGVAPPRPRTALAWTLEFLRPGGPVRDVVLFAQTGRFVNYGAGEPEWRGHPPPSFVRPADFALVVAVDRRVQRLPFFRLPESPAGPAAGRQSFHRAYLAGREDGGGG